MRVPSYIDADHMQKFPCHTQLPSGEWVLSRPERLNVSGLCFDHDGATCWMDIGFWARGSIIAGHRDRSSRNR